MKTKIENVLHHLLGGTCKMTVIGHQGKMLWILLFTRRATLAQGFENYAQLFRTLFFECVLFRMGGEITLPYKKRF